MEQFFDTREAASIAAAGRIHAALVNRLDKQDEASIVVTGGTSPQLCYAELARSDADWEHVHVLLSDERWVPADDEDSNEKLVRDNLLVDKAAVARLLPMYSPGEDVRSRCESLEETILTLPFPFACSLLGMGADGHFASLFPDAANLEEGLDPDSSQLFIAVDTAASPHARISLTLAALSRSDEIVLLFFGDEKRDIYERAKQDRNGFPVSRLLWQKRAPVLVYWAP
ncbi:MAG: 6-phosphogluconolactonase [Gammaproteobacteria bacterium]|nr:6-phosphogluconolactonase [Gammaproteobacteria bacterium]